MAESSFSPQRILLSGSSGLIGSAVRAALEHRGDQVTPLVRSGPCPGAVAWTASGQLTPDLVSGFDAVIHLAGEPVAARWTDARKRRILESRVEGTRRLVEALRTARHPPKSFLCASGINFYGDRGGAIVNESTPAGEGFLARVCVEWEAAAHGIADTARVASLRLGVVLTPTGGALATMLPLFRFGLAGPIAGGDRYLSWISLADTVRAILFALDHTELRGPVNLVSPVPLTGSSFTRLIAEAVGRPARLPVPAWLARLALGEVARETVLASIRAVPAELLNAGFAFEDGDLASALARWPLRQGQSARG